MKEKRGINDCKEGHGIGPKVHEWPFLGNHIITDDKDYRDTRLRENMVISIEPSINIPEKGELQIKDRFVIPKTGYKSLNNIPQEFINSNGGSEYEPCLILKQSSTGMPVGFH